jgi:aryl-alcohol dehydrogenase-like predicted oxidoreductase
MIHGYASADGTAKYAARFQGFPDNYRPMLGLMVSSIGMGTYLGEGDAAVDAAYAETLRAALLGGINLIDTAVNYRYQRSERVIGEVLEELTTAKEIAREEVIIATKGGYLTFDGEMPPNPREWFEDHFVKPGIVSPADVVQGSHCITPRYLNSMMETSRRNLGLETIDVYYLHNPEAQLAAVNRADFRERIARAFRFFEQAVKEGRIRHYGAATWNGFRVAKHERAYLSLLELTEIAREAGGEDHHFRMVQLPYNLAMAEALTSHNQTLPGGKTGSLLECAAQLGIAVCASASLLQGQLTQKLPEVLTETFLGMNSDAQRALQFVRSTPGVNVALAGMASAVHVSHNLETAKHPPASFATLMKLFQPT